MVRRYGEAAGPLIGARAVARAWVDPAYKRLLLEDSKAALAAFDLDFDRLVVVENTPAVHNLVVCTLCSCYPWSVLGLPPTWYKLPAYRSRAVSEPRASPPGVRAPGSGRARSAGVGLECRGALHGIAASGRLAPRGWGRPSWCRSSRAMP